MGRIPLEWNGIEWKGREGEEREQSNSEQKDKWIFDVVSMENTHLMSLQSHSGLNKRAQP